MSNFLTTEYEEQLKLSEDYSAGSTSAQEDQLDDALVITFEEEDDDPDLLLLPVQDDSINFSEEEYDQLLEQGLGFQTPKANDADSPKIPGASDYVDDGEEEEEEPEEEEDSDWVNDRDPKHFMTYILSSYPDGIPAHDGSSTLGCERAILYLTNLNKEISEALRTDKDDVLDLSMLEGIRVKMVKDIVTLKEHIKKLNKKRKKANLNGQEELIKEAGSPKIQLVVTPWERAITGIITNAVISAGKSFEDVYEYLKEKYTFTDREELSIMQLLMDMGHPIFKDRGLIGEEDDSDTKGVEFIKNYFA